MSLFTAVDESTDAALLAAYLDYFATHPAVARVKDRSHEVLAPAPGDHVLDLGCGNGRDLTVLAAAVETKGLVTGVDASAEMLGLASARLTDVANTHLVRAEAHRLPFHANSFDLARCERLLIHDHDPERTVTELARVTRPGGRVVLVEPDLPGMILRHPMQELTDEIVTKFLRHNFVTPHAGPALRAWLHAAGLVDVRAEVHAVACDYELADLLVEFRSCAEWATARSSVSSAQAAAWLAGLDTLNAEERFVCEIPMFIAGGAMPSGEKGAGHVAA